MNPLSRTAVITAVALALALAGLVAFLPTPTVAPTGDGRQAADTDADETAAATRRVIDNVRWFDGERMRPPAAITLAAGRIASIDTPGGGPKDAERMDAEGLTLLPGLIDAHVHTFDTALREAPRFGVTTVLDMFTDPALLGPARAVRDDFSPTNEAALFSAGMLATVAGGHGTQYGVGVETLAGPKDAPAWVDRRLAEGSDWIKLVYIPRVRNLPSLDLPTATAVIEAAHERGVLAVAHVSSLAGARDLLEAGIDGFVHVFADRPVDEDFLRRALEREVFFVPTLAVIAMAGGQSIGPDLVDDPHLGPRLGPTAKTNLRQDFGNPSSLFRLPTALENVRRLHAAGVPLLAGSDAPNPGTAHGAALHGELELLVRAGLSAVDALAAATAVPARHFGLENRGVIAEGARADLVLVEGRPDETITHTRRLHTVFRNGAPLEEAPGADAGTADATVRLAGTLGTFDERLDAPEGLVWAETSDAMMGGSSSATLERVARGEGGALAVTAEVAAGFPFPWAGAYLGPAAEGLVGDLGEARAVSFEVRGTPGDYRLMLFVAGVMGAPPTASFPVTGAWRRVEVPLDSMSGFEPDRFTGLALVTPLKSGAYAFEIDDVRLEP